MPLRFFPLPAEEASRGAEISIKGVVTAAERDWGGRFFIQDDSGGVFVENISNVQPAPGDVLAVSGVSYPVRLCADYQQTPMEEIGDRTLARSQAGGH